MAGRRQVTVILCQATRNFFLLGILFLYYMVVAVAHDQKL
jgi:hypothetical protein